MVNYLQQPMLRRIYALVWVTLVTVTLLQSSGQPVVGPPAPPGPPSNERELFLTTGHIVAFAVMMVLVWWALRPAKYALLVTLITCMTLGAVTELAQRLVPDRSSSIGDLLVNWIVSGVVALILYWRTS
jgi:VanZ family protein